MGAFDIVVIVLVAVALVAAVGTGIYKKISGKGGGCDCGDCEGCSHCSHCTPPETQPKEK